MATLQELEQALVAADAAGATADAQRLAGAIYMAKQRAPKTQGLNPQMGPSGGPWQTIKENANAALIGSGRTLDKVAQGNRQLGLNAMVAGKEALGMDSRPQLDALAQQEQVERGNDEVYGNLKREHPFGTALGEAGPLAVTPIGQATAMARVGVPAMVAGATGAMEYGSPQKRALKGTGQGVAGLLGGVTGEVSSLLINPVRNAMSTPAQDLAKQASAKIGAPMLPSQQTGSETLARMEDMFARYPGSAGVMGNITGQQEAAVARKLSEGTGAEDLTAKGLGARKAELGQKYEDMRGQIKGMPADSPVFDTIDKAEQMLTRGSTKGKESAIGMLRELKDKLYGTKQLSPEEYQGWVSDLASEARSTQNSTIAAALKMVGREMDKSARGPLAKEWGELDQQYGNLKTLMKPGIVNEVTGKANLGRFANAQERRTGEAGKTGRAEGPFQDVYEYARAVPQLRAGSPTAEREASASMLSPLFSAMRYGAAKGYTSDMMRDYLAKGLFASPEASRKFGLLAQSGALPLTIAPMNLGLLDFLSQ